jgi:RHS repeat-associated protein
MQSAQLQTLSESPLAAKPQLSEKPRLGFETKKTAGKPGPSVCNFIVTLGLRATVIENGVRKTYSARYYNPATGRFMSRDPEDGERTDPASLHKYLYAGGDPVNAMDPTGRAELFENVLIVGGSALGPVEEIAVAAWEGMTAWLTYYSGVARMVYLYASDVIRAIDWIKTTGWLAKQLECVLASYLVERYVAEPYLPNLHNGIANGLQKTAVVAAFDRVCIEWR